MVAKKYERREQGKTVRNLLLSVGVDCVWVGRRLVVLGDSFPEMEQALITRLDFAPLPDGKQASVPAH